MEMQDRTETLALYEFLENEVRGGAYSCGLEPGAIERLTRQLEGAFGGRP